MISRLRLCSLGPGEARAERVPRRERESRGFVGVTVSLFYRASASLSLSDSSSQTDSRRLPETRATRTRDGDTHTSAAISRSQ